MRFAIFLPMQEKTARIIAKLQTFFKEAGFQKAVVGLSGGVDSALTAKLGVMALGKEKVTGILMPHEGMSSPSSLKDAEDLAKELGISYHIVPINPFIGQYKNLPWKSSPLADVNIQARARAVILYHFANTHNALVLGTGNKTEETLGYFTKYGDGACDVLPIGNLYKTQVWEMGAELGLPEVILKKAPSAELMEGQTDEGEIGLSYSQMDEILRKFETGGKPESEQEKALMKRIVENAHKGKVPPVL